MSIRKPYSDKGASTGLISAATRLLEAKRLRNRLDADINMLSRDLLSHPDFEPKRFRAQCSGILTLRESWRPSSSFPLQTCRNHMEKELLDACMKSAQPSPGIVPGRILDLVRILGEDTVNGNQQSNCAIKVIIDHSVISTRADLQARLYELDPDLLDIRIPANYMCDWARNMNEPDWFRQLGIDIPTRPRIDFALPRGDLERRAICVRN